MTTIAYNHQKVLENLTVDQYTQNLQQAYDSYLKARKGDLIACGGCGKDFMLYKLFRCYFCRSFFCSKCAKQHFE